MAKKRYINTVFWDDSYISNLDPSEKLLFVYLITISCTNISGIYQIQMKRISLDTGIEKEMCQKIMDRFQKDEKILFKDGWIAIKNFIKHQNINSPQVIQGIKNEFSLAPNELKIWIKLNISSFTEILDTVSIEYPYSIDTQSHLNLNLNLNSDLNLNLNSDLNPDLNLDLKKESAFRPPSLEEIKAHMTENNITSFTAEQFYYFYDSKNWMIGKNKMKKWKSAIQTFKHRADSEVKKDRRMFSERNAYIDSLPAAERQKLIDQAKKDKIK